MAEIDFEEKVEAFWEDCDAWVTERCAEIRTSGQAPAEEAVSEIADLIEQRISSLLEQGFQNHGESLDPEILSAAHHLLFELELKKSGFKVERQIPLNVYYEDELVGNYFADLLINNEIVVELKAIDSLNHTHEIQLVNYLNAIKKDFGLLINFGSSVQVKRKYRFYTKTR